MSLQSWMTKAFVKVETTACLMEAGLADEQQRYKAACNWWEAVAALEAGQIEEFRFWRDRARAPENNERYSKEQRADIFASKRQEVSS